MNRAAGGRPLRPGRRGPLLSARLLGETGCSNAEAALEAGTGTCTARKTWGTLPRTRSHTGREGAWAGGHGARSRHAAHTRLGLGEVAAPVAAAWPWAPAWALSVPGGLARRSRGTPLPEFSAADNTTGSLPQKWVSPPGERAQREEEGHQLR